MKKALLSAAAAICAATLTAAIEEEMMIIRLANGNTVEYPVESVSSVRFEVREIRQDFMVRSNRNSHNKPHIQSCPDRNRPTCGIRFRHS